LVLKLQGIIRKLDKNWKEAVNPVAPPSNEKTEGATDGDIARAAIERCTVYADYIDTCLTLPESTTDKQPSNTEAATLPQESKRWNRTLSFIHTKGYDASSAVNRAPEARISMSTIQRKDTMSTMASLKRSNTRLSLVRLGGNLARNESRKSYSSLQRKGTSGGLAPYHQRYGTGTSLSSFNTRAPSARNSIQTSTSEECDELEQLTKLRERLEWLQVYDQEEFNVQNQIFKAKVQEWISRVHLTMPPAEMHQEQDPERRHRRNGLYLPSF
jgi:hypothetical protein